MTGYPARSAVVVTAKEVGLAEGITYQLGDATSPIGEGRKIVAHIVNDAGRWGKGFVVAVSKRWPAAESAYRQWYAAGTGFELGGLQLVDVAADLWVANLIGQHGLLRRGGKTPPVRYAAIETGLTVLAAEAVRLSATVHMPRIGCGLSGGRWEQVEPIVRRTLVAAGLGVTVYDLV